MTSLKGVLEEAPNKPRFEMKKLAQDVLSALSQTPTSKRYMKLAVELGEETSKYVLTSLLRAAFFTEIVKTPKIETTKMEVHWVARLSTSDPRHASFEDCYQIFEEGMEAVENAITEKENRALLKLLSDKHLLAYEIPFDYDHREITGQIHRPDNMVWLWDDEWVKRAIKLRAVLVSPSINPYASVFSKAYSDKIKVKTYLTDRVLTGEHKTNREKRWEVHPGSVHFAFRRVCMGIEYQLVSQLCRFEGFPTPIRQKLEAHGLLEEGEIPCRCPITLDPLHFDKFADEISHPTHGKSEFQVGHLNPLKAINNDPYSGHTPANISWISFDGNRIQGSLTLEQTRKLLGRIVTNYDQLGVELEPGTEEETKAEEVVEEGTEAVESVEDQTEETNSTL